MKIALGQINPRTGNIPFNKKRILSFIEKAGAEKAGLLIFPEMALTGYPPLDLIKRGFFLKQALSALKSLNRRLPKGLTVLLGGAGPGPSNAVFVLQKNKNIKVFSKQCLADYDVFDEQRYFKKGNLKNNFFVLKNWKIQVLICEEMWKNPTAFEEKKPSGRKKDFLIVSVNASPFTLNKSFLRKKQAEKWAKKNKSFFVYLNSASQQEELIFDGGSFVLNPKGEEVFQSPFFKEDLSFFFLPDKKKPAVLQKALKKPGAKKTRRMESLAQALTFGLREFAQKNGFKKAHIGLSGGVDSALAARLACRALGEVSLLFLPGPFTSLLSEKCALKTAKLLNKDLTVFEITRFYVNILKSLNLEGGKTDDITQQNIQARLRAIFLMAYANSRRGSLLISTSNKSELSLGYGTLYGDLAGGIAPLGDLFKSEVYELASYLKIPSLILKRKASAELKKNQSDEQDLYPYKILDPALKKLMEKEQDPKNNFEKTILKRLIKSEFKRRQAPPVLKVKERSFDRGWRIALSTDI